MLPSLHPSPYGVTSSSSIPTSRPPPQQHHPLRQTQSSSSSTSVVEPFAFGDPFRTHSSSNGSQTARDRMPALGTSLDPVRRASSTYDLAQLDRRRSSTPLGPDMVSDTSSILRAMAASGAASRQASHAGSDSSHRTPAANAKLYSAQQTTMDRTQRRKSSTQDAILPSLQIPPSINNSKGSLAEFAAQVRIDSPLTFPSLFPQGVYFTSELTET